MAFDDESQPEIPPEIHNLILLDREVDMITPMCTQLTYEGGSGAGGWRLLTTLGGGSRSD